MGMPARARSRASFTFTLTAIALALAACGSDDDGDDGTAAGAVEIKTLSSRADLVSGDDALVEIVLPAGATETGLRVQVGDRDVSSAFARRADGRVTGLVTGLASGNNTLRATLADGRAATLIVTSTPRGTPLLAGAQPTEFVCATPTPQAATATAPATNGSGLSGTASGPGCDIPTEIRYYYRSNATGCSLALPDPIHNLAYTATTVSAAPTPPANPCFRPYTPGTTPTDLATTTTDTGAQVPYIVRLERGTMNRGIYDIAVLANPDQPWTGAVPQAQWNGKVLYRFGSSTGQPRRQARPQGTWTDDVALGRGYMVVANSMTDSLQNSNRVMMSETVMRMKEHITDQYGPIRFTMGTGCSGGSINANMNASINPGLLDGITVSCTYPDSETTTIEVSDCVLLVEAYQRPAWLALMQAQGLTQAQINAKKAAINGHVDQTACHGWFNSFGSNAKAGNYFQRTVGATAANFADHDTGVIRQSPAPTNNCQLPAAQVYDPVTNPNGARCNAWGWAQSIWGTVAGTNVPRDTRDNTGVQYGLKALRDGAITPEEFVTLNEIVGGTDRDTNLVSTRSVADREALDIAYRAGIVLDGRQLAKTAVIDMRGWDDSLLIVPPGLAALGLTPVTQQNTAIFGIHMQWRSFSIRDRLDRDAGGHGNQAIWRFGRTGFAAPASLATEAFLSMDQWLTTLKADTTTDPIERKVARARPADATDHCRLSSDPAQARVTDQATCDADPFLRATLSPRQVAGGPRSEDVLKCQLKALDAADWAPAVLTPVQVSRMQAVFPDGVCDWTKPGVGQQAAVGGLSFRSGPGGTPLGAAPVSTPVR